MENLLITRVRGFIREEDENYISFNLWGGDHIYNKKNKSYIIRRSCGLFSNLTVSLFGIFLIYNYGFEIEEMQITMTDYYYNEDAYSKLFEINPSKIDFSEFSQTELVFFVENCIPSNVGLGLSNWTTKQSTKDNFNLKITDKILKKFFQPKENVLSMVEKMLFSKKLNGSDFIFVWARRTDKVEENPVPNAQSFFNTLKENNLLSNRIFLQTDDKTMFEEFKNTEINFEMFDEIPFPKGYSFHRSISQTPDEIFSKEYGLTKDEYFVKMMCVVLIATKSKKVLIYPGNPTTVVPMFKNSFEDCFLFKNQNELY